MTDHPWHADHGTLVAVAHHAHDEGELIDADAVLDFFEKPWHYDEYHAAYVVAAVTT